MIIKFANLGAIKETQLDLRPLTVIIGPNNSNKTYIAYSIYALWEHLKTNGGFGEVPSPQIENEDQWILKIDNKFVKSLVSSKESLKLDLENFFQDSSQKLFSKTTLNYDLQLEDIRTGLREGEISTLSSNLGTFNLLTKDDSLVLERNKTDILSPDDKTMLSRFLNHILTTLLNSLFFHSPLLLPAERNAFIITYKLLAHKRLGAMRDLQRGLLNESILEHKLELMREQGDIRYPKPIEDFLDFLSEVEMKPQASIGHKQKNEFQLLADEIEEHILSGNKTSLRSTKLQGRDIKVKVKKGLNIDLYNASSSIKQLTPLLLYLRHRAQKGDFLIIDEPEMNLHPESQAKLLEVLGMLVNLGVRVLLTTHSPYLLAHLNNLVSGDVDNPEVLQKQKSSMYLKDERAFLSEKKVSAYEMKNNKLKSLKDKEYGIRWDTLSNVSSEIQQTYFELQEKMSQD